MFLFDLLGGRNRRLSLQVGPAGAGGVNQLSKDMERLRVGSATADGKGARGISPRPLKRKPSKRSSRSSKNCFHATYFVSLTTLLS